MSASSELPWGAQHAQHRGVHVDVDPDAVVVAVSYPGGSKRRCHHGHGHQQAFVPLPLVLQPLKLRASTHDRPQWAPHANHANHAS